MSASESKELLRILNVILDEEAQELERFYAAAESTEAPNTLVAEGPTTTRAPATTWITSDLRNRAVLNRRRAELGLPDLF